MKLYIAAPYAARAQAKAYAEEVTRIGFTIVSRWLDENYDIGPSTTGAATGLTDEQVARHASDDLYDVSRAHLFVLLTAEAVGGEPGSGGRHVETGFAIAKDIPIIVVGKPENIFHRLGRAAMCVPTWHEAVIELSARLVRDRAPRVMEAAR